MVKLQKRKAEVTNEGGNESLVENSGIKAELFSPIKVKKKKTEDVSLNSEDHTGEEYVHVVERKRKHENNTGNFLNGDYCSNDGTVSSAGLPNDGMLQQNSEKKNKKAKVPSTSDVGQLGNGETGSPEVKKRHVSFALRDQVKYKVEMKPVKPSLPNPKKKRTKKKTSRPTDDRSEEEEDDDDEVGENEEEKEDVSTVVKPPAQPFSVDSFRKSLNKDHNLKSLKSFASHLAKPIEEDTADVATDYIKAGGSAMEILQQLETKDEDNFAVATAVFTALHSLIMRSLTDVPDLRPSCEEACRYLLNAYSLTIQKMLSEKAGSQDIKATLKLLTGVVTINSVFAKDVLANVKFPPPIIKIMVTPSRLGEKTNIRTCFIHFLMAFLIDKDPSLIRSFLEKQGLLKSILPGLVFDKVETVHLVLTTLRTCVVENKYINKNQKRQVFNTDSMRLLFKVYSWHGPRKGSRKMWQTNFEGDCQDLMTVIDALQQLLLVLCTSHKLGIVFVDPTLGTSNNYANELIHKAIKELENPWEHDHTRELIVKLLVACPDLVRNRMNTMPKYLEPRASPSWLNAMAFVKQIVEAMEPEVCLKPHVRVVPRDQLPSIIQVLSAPSILMPIIKDEMLLHTDIIVRQTVLELLVVMFKQMGRFLDALEEWAVIGPSERLEFRLKATRHLPKIELLLQVWNEPPLAQNISDAVLLEVPLSLYLSTLLDVMLLQNITCPSLTASTGGDIPIPVRPDKPLKLDLCELMDVIEQVEDVTQMAAMKVKAVHMVFEFKRDSFPRSKKVFSHSVEVLLKCLHDVDPTVSQSACSVLTTILQSTGLFDEFLIEVHIWIHCYQQLSVGMREIAAKLLTRGVCNILREKPDRFKPKEKTTVVHEGDENSEKEEKKLAKVLNISTSQPQPSLLLPGILKQMAKEKIMFSREMNAFLKNVVIHLSHPLTSLKEISRFVQVEDKLGIAEYIQWSYENTNDIARSLMLLFGGSSVEYRLSLFILGLESEFNSAIELLQSSQVPEKKVMEMETDDLSSNALQDELEDINPVHLMLLFNLTLFQTTRLVVQRKLTEVSGSRSADAFITILQLLKLHLAGQTSPKGQCLDLQSVTRFFYHPILLKSFAPIDSKSNEKKGKKLPTELILSLALWTASSYPDDVRRDVLKLYKNKIVNSLVRVVRKKPAKAKKGDNTFANVTAIITIFDVEYKDLVRILEAMTSSHYSHLRMMVEDSPESLSSWGELLTYLIEHTVALRVEGRMDSGCLPPHVVTSLAKMYIKLRACETLNLSLLEESLIKYLQRFPHSQQQVPHQVLVATLNTQPKCETAARLGVLLLSRNKVLGSVFSGALIQSSEAGKIVTNSPLIFSCCQILIEHCSPTSDKILQIVYEHFRKDIIKGIKKPHKARLNMVVIINMIEKCMPDETCAELCNYIEEHASKLLSNGGQEFHIALIESLFTKPRLDSNDNNEQLVRLAKLLLEWLTQAAKTDKTKLGFLCKSLGRCVDQVVDVERLEEIRTSPAWFPFTTQMLKLGLQPHDAECDRGLLLETLACVCQVIYKDSSNDKEVMTLFEMTLSHSEFLGVMLGSTPTKLALVRLLTTFVAKNLEVMSSKHVPILLGAYGASLSLTDQLILKLINTYEANNISMYECRPYLWGEAAVNYYCVKSKETTSLWRQPQTSQVLELLKMDMVQRTIKKFPLERKPDLEEFADEPYVYDPAFFLPLFSHLLSPESVLQPFKFTHTGGIALTLASLASHSFEIRALGYHVLSRYHCHLDASRGRDRVWWLHFVDAIKQGVVDLGEEGVQLACIVTTFLARASLVISKPLDPMFGPLNKFILAKPSMNLNTIPELYILFNSTDLESKTHRHFLLEVLRDGLRLKFDWQLAMNCTLFQLLFTYYSSIISNQDNRSKVLILQVVNTSMQIPEVAKFFIGGYGFFSWFHQTVRQLKSSDHDLIIPSIQIISSLWHSVVVSKEKTHAIGVNKAFVKVNVSLLLIAILTKLPPKMTLEELKKFLLILQSVLLNTTPPQISEKHLSTLVLFCKDLLGPLDDCHDMLKFGCKFVGKNCKIVNTGNEVEEVKIVLREIILLWWNRKKRNQSQFLEKGKSKVKKPRFRTGMNKGASNVVKKATLNVKKAKKKNKLASKKLAVLSKKKKKKKEGASLLAKTSSVKEKRTKKKIQSDTG